MFGLLPRMVSRCRGSCNFHITVPPRHFVPRLCADKIFEAYPKVPWLNGAAFSLPNKPKFVDNDNNIQIELVEKIVSSYKIKTSRMK